MDIQGRELIIDGRAASVALGGQGDPLLLIHGGWGGAALHWGKVWERLSERFRVIAPDLPGIGRTDQPALGSVDAYCEWLVKLLGELGVSSAWLVGNSFGAGLAWELGLRHPTRCRGVILVDGGPLPSMPGWLTRLGKRPLAHRLLRSMLHRMSFGPAAMRRAFADPAQLPSELREVFFQKAPPQLDALVDVLVGGGSRAHEAQSPLIIFGTEDHLGSERSVKRLRDRLPGARLQWIPAAGHLPQLENPEAFVTAVTSFVQPR